MKKYLGVEVCRAVHGRYDTFSEQANALLTIISQGANATARVRLMEEVVTTFGLTAEERAVSEPPSGTGVSNEEYARLHGKFEDGVETLLKQTSHQNPKPSSFARRILEFLNRLEDDEEKAVALAMVLRSSLVPYAQLPKGFFDDAVAMNDVRASNSRVMESMALIHRAIHEPEATTPMRMAGIQNALARHNPAEQKILLGYTFLHFSNMFRRSQGPRGIAILAAEAPDYPIHGKGERKKESKPPPN